MGSGYRKENALFCAPCALDDRTGIYLVPGRNVASNRRATEEVAAIEKLMSLGIMSLNESRALLGLEPIEGGNKRLQSLNFVDADKANQYQVGTEEPKDENNS